MYFQIQKLQDYDIVLFKKLRSYCYDINGCCQAVHNELGPFLNEYMYQDALEIILSERCIPFVREYFFTVDFHGKRIRHKHYVDFLVRNKVFIECKAIESIGVEQRRQLWNYMRLTKTRIGIIWNFAPMRDQSEHYYLDTNNNIMYAF